MPMESAIFFYFSYLIAFYLEDDLNSAKYLWKRVPQILKVGSFEQLIVLTNIWQVGQCLFEEDIASAIQYICSRNWMPNIHPLIQVGVFFPPGVLFYKDYLLIYRTEIIRSSVGEAIKNVRYRVFLYKIGLLQQKHRQN